ncbi:MAG: hypothetical protein SGARI_003548, partial [Bacillariaceae sp.]
KLEMDTTTLPTATIRTMRAKKAAVLPPPVVAPEQVLVDAFGGREELRAWTCQLTTRFVAQDQDLKPLFQNIPLLDMEPYLHALLQFAFVPDSNPKREAKTLRQLRFPLGLAVAENQVTAAVFDKMITHLEEVGEELHHERLQEAIARLENCYTSFADCNGRMRRQQQLVRKDSVVVPSNGRQKPKERENAIFAWAKGRRRSSKA